MRNRTQLSSTAVIASIALVHALGFTYTYDTNIPNSRVDSFDVHANVVDAMCWLKRLRVRPASIMPSQIEIIDKIHEMVSERFHKHGFRMAGLSVWRKMKADPSDLVAFYNEWRELRKGRFDCDCSDLAMALYFTWRYDPTFDTINVAPAGAEDAEEWKFEESFVHKFLRLNQE